MSPPIQHHKGRLATPPRIGHRRLLLGLAGISIVLVITLILQFSGALGGRPGAPWLQLSAMAGGLLLMTPLLFSLAKRSSFSVSPPRWFAAHVLASMAGFVFISLHVAAGRLFSTPGILYLLLLFLIFQGIVARVFLSQQFSRQFGSRESSFTVTHATRRELAEVIASKTLLLTRLEPQASEALFSPNLRHAMNYPLLTLRYARLMSRESHLVGARRRAGRPLSMWRRLHIFAALLFLTGIIIHVVAVTFLAGYVAGDDTIYWWHLATWGGET
ncbi:hypothetical protein SAMN04487951_101375 [Vreelandella arcis]|uniref:Ferric reductase like transmembrane component n=2 Tax=Vreelandella arcis TaxID=416873 RepID=A0A1G9XQ31_9GAMM|nr:hypothetical protein SAMN04487951_101375 [Halomonas arcis]